MWIISFLRRPLQRVRHDARVRRVARCERGSAAARHAPTSHPPHALDAVARALRIGAPRAGQLRVHADGRRRDAHSRAACAARGVGAARAHESAVRPRDLVVQAAAARRLPCVRSAAAERAEPVGGRDGGEHRGDQVRQALDRLPEPRQRGAHAGERGRVRAHAERLDAVHCERAERRHGRAVTSRPAARSAPRGRARRRPRRTLRAHALPDAAFAAESPICIIWECVCRWCRCIPEDEQSCKRALASGGRVRALSARLLAAEPLVLQAPGRFARPALRPLGQQRPESRAREQSHTCSARCCSALCDGAVALIGVYETTVRKSVKTHSYPLSVNYSVISTSFGAHYYICN